MRNIFSFFWCKSSVKLNVYKIQGGWISGPFAVGQVNFVVVTVAAVAAVKTARDGVAAFVANAVCNFFRFAQFGAVYVVRKAQ